MIVKIPILGGVYIGRHHKRIVARKIVEGAVARKNLELMYADNAAVVRKAGAMERACCLAIDALQARQEADPGIAPVLDQIQAELAAVYAPPRQGIDPNTGKFFFVGEPGAPPFENGWGNV